MLDAEGNPIQSGPSILELEPGEEGTARYDVRWHCDQVVEYSTTVYDAQKEQLDTTDSGTVDDFNNSSGANQNVSVNTSDHSIFD